MKFLVLLLALSCAVLLATGYPTRDPDYEHAVSVMYDHRNSRPSQHVGYGSHPEEWHHRRGGLGDFHGEYDRYVTGGHWDRDAEKIRGGYGGRYVIPSRHYGREGRYVDRYGDNPKPYGGLDNY